jgi:chemotaxis protein CheD
MNEIVYVNTGEVKLGDNNTILNSGAIGSCVVVCMYNSFEKRGAMAHIMLPGVASVQDQMKTKYASNAILKLMDLMNINGNQSTQLETCIIGGANVLKRPNDTIGKNNIESVEKLLDEHGIRVSIKAIGGYERRTVDFNVEKGLIYYTTGDSSKKMLWKTDIE